MSIQRIKSGVIADSAVTSEKFASSLTLPANVAVTNGIAFPATQSASANANTLDDYEEGTWTPGYSLDSGSVSDVTSSGTYIKIGRQVTLTLYIGFGTSSSGLINRITNYPFTAQNTDERAVGSVRENTNTGFQWHWRADNNQNFGLLRRYDNNQALTSGMLFLGTLTYFTA